MKKNEKVVVKLIGEKRKEVRNKNKVEEEGEEKIHDAGIKRSSGEERQHEGGKERKEDIYATRMILRDQGSREAGKKIRLWGIRLRKTMEGGGGTKDKKKKKRKRIWLGSLEEIVTCAPVSQKEGTDAEAIEEVKTWSRKKQTWNRYGRRSHGVWREAEGQSI